MLTACTPAGSLSVCDSPGTKRPSANTSRAAAPSSACGSISAGRTVPAAALGENGTRVTACGLEWRQLSSLLVGSPCSARWAAASRRRACKGVWAPPFSRCSNSRKQSRYHSRRSCGCRLARLMPLPRRSLCAPTRTPSDRARGRAPCRRNGRCGRRSARARHRGLCIAAAAGSG